MPQENYLLAHQPSELERLRLQSLVWEPAGRQLLSKVSGGSGGRALDVGCGAMGWLRILSEWVGPTGRVVGTDIDESLLGAARSFLEAESVSNAELVIDDLFDLQPTAFGAVFEGNVLEKVTEVGTAVGHAFAGFFIVLFATYFFLADGARIWAWVVRLFPRAARTLVPSAAVEGARAMQASRSLETRWSAGGSRVLACVANLTPVPRHGYRLGPGTLRRARTTTPRKIHRIMFKAPR